MITTARAPPLTRQMFVDRAPWAETHAQATCTAIKSGTGDCASRVGVTGEVTAAAFFPSFSPSYACRASSCSDFFFSSSYVNALIVPSPKLDAILDGALKSCYKASSRQKIKETDNSCGKWNQVF